MHLFFAGIAILLSPFRTEILEMSQMWFAVHMTILEIHPASRAISAIWYHLLCKDTIGNGVKVPIVQATASFSCFPSLTPAIFPFTVCFNMRFTHVLKQLYLELFRCLYKSLRSGTRVNTSPQLLLASCFSVSEKYLEGIDFWWRMVGPSRSNKHLVWICWNNIWDISFVIQAVNTIGASPSGRMNWPSGSQ